MKIFRINLILIVGLLFSGCGDKLIEVNTFGDLNYAYMGHSENKDDPRIIEEVRNDSAIISMQKESLSTLDEKINRKLSTMLKNKDNSLLEPEKIRKTNTIYNDDRFNNLTNK